MRNMGIATVQATCKDFMPSEWEGVEQAQGCTCACSTVEVARNERMEGEVDEVDDDRGEGESSR
jgi:hypothetical protein